MAAITYDKQRLRPTDHRDIGRVGITMARVLCAAVLVTSSLN